MNIGVIPVRLADYFTEQSIFLDLNAENKMDAFQVMVSSMGREHVIAEPNTFLQEVVAREAIESTCIGRGVAFPHTRTACVEKPVIAFARTSKTITSVREKADKIKFIFMMGTPKNEANEYLQILARLCRLLRNHNFREKLQTATTPKEILQLFTDFDTHLS